MKKINKEEVKRFGKNFLKGALIGYAYVCTYTCTILLVASAIEARKENNK